MPSYGMGLLFCVQIKAARTFNSQGNCYVLNKKENK